MSDINLKAARDWLCGKNLDVSLAPLALVPGSTEVEAEEGPEPSSLNAKEHESDELPEETRSRPAEEREKLTHATKGNLQLQLSISGAIPQMSSTRVWLNYGKAPCAAPSSDVPRDRSDSASTTPSATSPSTATPADENPMTLSDLIALSESWKTKSAAGGRQTDAGSVSKYRADWPKIEAFFQAKGLPCHSFAEGEHTLNLRSKAYYLDDAAQLNHTRVTLIQRTGAEIPEGDSPESVSIIKIGSAGASAAKHSIISVPSHAVGAKVAEGWEFWHPPTPAKTLTEWGYWADTRKNDSTASDVLMLDNPNWGASLFLGIGHGRMAEWSKGRWQQGNLLGPGGEDATVKKKTATYADPKDWDKIQDDRVATSKGHILVNGRPRGVAPGWGGYDEFTEWQASGRKIHSWMVSSSDTVVTDSSLPVAFETVGGATGPTVRNQVDMDKGRFHKREGPMSLHEVFNRKKTGRRYGN